MSSPSASAARVDFIPLHRIAAACGITSHELHFSFRPSHWGIPGHWRLQAGVTLYKVSVLHELAQELQNDGQPAAAEKLRDFVSELTAGHGGTDAGQGLDPLRTTAMPARDFAWQRRADLA